MKNEKVFDVTKLKERLKEFLKKRVAERSARLADPRPTYSVKDVYEAAIREMKKEVAAMSKKPLTPEEENKLELLARTVSNEVLKNMKVV